MYGLPMKFTQAILSAGAFLFASCLPHSFAANERPNIVFIITDQHHAGMMSAAGNPHLETPALDSLANQGVRFTKAYVANPVCMPSRVAMATGMMPGRLGVFNNGMKADIPEHVDENSLGKLMKRAGYDTFYGGKTHLSPSLEPRTAGYDKFFKNQREELPAACIEFIETPRENPFFVVASFINPHDICFAFNAYKYFPQRLPLVDELYKQATQLPLDQLPPLPANHNIQTGEPIAIESSLKINAVTPAKIIRKEYDELQWRYYRWIYCRLTERVDGHIAKILDALKLNGLDENTIVLFTADHGDMDASHGLASKNHFYEESSGVPFLMRQNGSIPAGVVNDTHLISTGLDILPTLCDYAGIAAPNHLIGRSLRPIAEGRQTKEHRKFVVSENNIGRMVRSDRYKYCVYIEGDQRESLVDLKKDPGELTNLATHPEYQDILYSHQAYLQKWIEESGDEEAKSFAISGNR
ncbi:MAG: arylsulfatase A-like enzyme [Candidatus Pelagisphaera sp.]|jgi:arylsulfatase A-like enzyme